MNKPPDDNAELPADFVEFLNRIKAKRPRTVIRHILTHGFVTTEELRTLYGYNHPPRAARDVRDQGVPLVTFRVVGSDGRSIGAYRFGDPAAFQNDRIGGRRAISKAFKDALLAEAGHACAVCLQEYDAQHLQVDHRIPYRIVGDFDYEDRQKVDYMLLCGSCNRAKSWSCEHCPNWNADRASSVCETCYWANPQEYDHIAAQPIRRVDLTWMGEGIHTFEDLKQQALSNEESLQDYIKAVLAHHLRRDR